MSKNVRYLRGWGDVMKKACPVIFTQLHDVILVEVSDLEILTEEKDMAAVRL